MEGEEKKKNPALGNSVSRNALLIKSEENGQTGLNWQEVYGTSNNHSKVQQ